MPGRRSTGPPVSTSAKPPRRKPKRALDALAIAEKEHPRKNRVRQARLGELEDQGGPQKRKREGQGSGDGDDDSDEEDDDNAASKRARRGGKDSFGNEIEVGSDSSGNEWVVGQVDKEDDSDLDSEMAFGESDEEKFGAFSFGQRKASEGQSRRQSAALQGSGGDEDFAGFDMAEEEDQGQDNDEESDGFAEDAVDLAGVLDDGGSDDGDSGASDDESESGEHDSAFSYSGDEDDTGDTNKLASLQALVSSMNEQDAYVPRTHAQVDAQELATPSEFGLHPRQKLTVADLVTSVTDPALRRSLKMLADNDPKGSTKRGIAKTLDAPLPQRQQDRINRAAAGDRSKGTLNRWIDTVKHNRRADHLSFPLQKPNAVAPPGSKRLLTNDQTQPATDLEKTIQNILQENGLAPTNGKSEEVLIQEFEELAAQKMPLAEVQARRAELRRARELLFREEVRAKRIKKIKSKSFRKVHRKERERNAQQERSILAEAGFEESADERERNDRRRAEERMGARHRESKWARGVKDSGRAKWDEDARGGVTEMARREEELRKRMEGREIDDSDESFSDDAEDIDTDDGGLKKLSGRLQELETDGDLNASNEGLAGMKFMKKAEAARKVRNDIDAERLRRELAGEETPSEHDADESAGRRSYGPSKKLGNGKSEYPVITTEQSEFEEKPRSDAEGDLDFQGFEDDTEIITNTPKVPSMATTEKYHSISNPKSRQRPSTDILSDNIASNPWLSTAKTPSEKRRRHREDADASVIISNTFAPPSETISAALPDPKSRSASKQIAVISHKANGTPHQPNSISRTSDRASSGQDTRPASNGHDVDDDDDDDDNDDDDDTKNDLPLLPSNTSLIHRAFAGDSVLASFADEKAADAAASAPQEETSTAVPGWGSWTGPGISKKELKRSHHHHRQQQQKKTTTPGTDPAKRKDAKLSKVIISQSRVKKNAKYLAKELPFPFTTAQQYERSLRVPVGGEWTTKETFQDMTKPRILRKQGVVVGAIEMPVV